MVRYHDPGAGRTARLHRISCGSLPGSVYHPLAADRFAEGKDGQVGRERKTDPSEPHRDTVCRGGRPYHRRDRYPAAIDLYAQQAPGLRQVPGAGVAVVWKKSLAVWWKDR